MSKSYLGICKIIYRHLSQKIDNYPNEMLIAQMQCQTILQASSFCYTICDILFKPAKYTVL